MLKKGKRIRSQTKEVVCSVYSYFEKQSRKTGISTAPLYRTAQATGISRTTITRIRHERRGLQEGEKFTTPPKRYSRSRRRVDADDFDREAIRRRIYHLYEQKVNITLNRLLVRLRRRIVVLIFPRTFNTCIEYIYTHIYISFC